MYEGQMITSGLNNSGDVILPAEKKSRKGIIIAIVLVALLIIGVLVFVFLIPKGGVNLGGDAKSAFNRYANYILYGKDSTDEISGGYNAEEPYLFFNMDEMSLNERDSFLEDAQSLLDSFRGYLNSGMSSEFLSTFSEYVGDFTLVKMVNSNPALDDSTFLEEYEKDNSEQWVESNVSNYTSSGYDVVKQYGEDVKYYYKLYTKYLDEARDADCLNLDNDFPVCDSFENKELEDQVEYTRFNLFSAQDEAASNVVMGCFRLSDEIYGRNTESAESDETVESGGDEEGEEE